MGLDMYLTRSERIVPVSEKDILEAVKNPKLMSELLERINNPKVVEGEEVAYWRKANAVHGWFVNNVQNGVDDGGSYEVSKEKLENLLGLCQTILETKDVDKAKSTLPTTEGFFFGDTEYDEFYFAELNETVRFITDILETTDFETQVIEYLAWW